jgi:poly-gamma-glutamate synthesis protein (capsule biosynthesis protein)
MLAIIMAGMFAFSYMVKISSSYQNATDSWLQAQILGNLLNNISYQDSESSIIFVGDVMVSRFIQTLIERNGNDYNFPFLLSLDFLNSADAAFGNFEGTISNRGSNQGSQYSFRAKPEVVSGLQSANFKAISVANNHIFDWGRDALLDTIAFLKYFGIETAGAGANYEQANSSSILNVKGTKIALFAYTNLYPDSLEATEKSAGISSFNSDALKSRINFLKQENKVDIIVVSFHWGDEYATSSNFLQKEIAHEIIDSGADLIIGHHPHVVEESEQYKGKWIFYSLGNFIFDQGFLKETMEGMAVKVFIKNKAIGSVKIFKVKLNRFFQPEIID